MVNCSGKYYVLNKKISDLNKTISGQIDKIAEQNKTIVKIQSIKVDQSKKIDDLENKVSGLLNTIKKKLKITYIQFF